MRVLSGLKPVALLLLVCVLALAIGVIPTSSVRSASTAQTPVEQFLPAALQGFGDRQNSIAWSMVWWKGHLYVGTGRSTQCQQVATMEVYLPFITYPPLEPDIACASSPQDLPLQAEIWRWAPETNVWERVFQSPNDVPIPGHEGKFVARDIGFRGITIFTEADGTEALYISGVSSRSFNEGVPPPRILRSADGVNWTAVPQDPGTVLGDTDAVGFRGMTTYKNRLYVITSVGLLGQGYLMESANPASGNNSFQKVTPDEMTLYEVDTFNGHLYVGTASRTDPFAVLRTDAEGLAPYQWTPVIEDGGNRQQPSKTVVSMHTFKGQLYVGTDRPAELYRINPDDTWDLIMGQPRLSWDGEKRPLSGMDTGFDWFATQHVWRMETHDNRLYVSTMDSSTRLRVLPFGGYLLGPNLGFDLFVSDDGETFSELTRSGFDDKFNVGARNMVSTPYGMFIGSQNHYYGFEMWRSQDTYSAFLPALLAGGSAEEPPVEPPGETSVQALAMSPVAPRSPAPARDLQAEHVGGKIVLSWQPSTGATSYSIYRSGFVRQTALENETIDGETIDGEAWIRGQYKLLATTDKSVYVDKTALPGQYFHYYVVATNASGGVSRPSNLLRAPSLAAPTTFDDLEARIDQRLTSGTPQPDELNIALARLRAGHEAAASGDLAGAGRSFDQFVRLLNQTPASDAVWWFDETRMESEKLARRIQLAQAGLINADMLLEAGE